MKKFIAQLLMCSGSLFFLTSCSWFNFEKGDVKVNVNQAFNECLKICYDNSYSRQAGVYSACLEGCGSASRDYPYKGDTFGTMETCEDKINSLDKARYVNESINICKDFAREPLRQQGCIEGARNFYNAVTAFNACESTRDPGNILSAPQTSPDSTDNESTDQPLSE